MSKQRQIALVPLVLLLLLVAAWGIDATVSGDRVMRQVSMKGASFEEVALDGLDHDDLRGLAADLTTALGRQTALVTVGDNQAELDPVSLGVRIDPDRLADEALSARRDGFFLFRPFRWLSSFFSEHEIDPPFTVDREVTVAASARLVETILASPVEPTLVVTSGEVVVQPGSEGTTLDPEDLARALPTMMEAGAPYALTLEPLPRPPRLDAAILEAVAAEANERTQHGLRVRVLDDQVRTPAEQLRTWVILDPEGEVTEADDTRAGASAPSWAIDEELMLADLRPAFPTLGGSESQARFEIVDGRPIVIPSAESLVCCTEGSANSVMTALAQAPPTAEDGSTPAPLVELEAVVTGGDESAAALEGLGIIEEVSTFTTRHSCCENRVTNIQLMADIVRGTVVRPGETFSLNGLVGKRTAERGFLPAGAIAQGVLEDQVGGGVSQFATTIFNAAFFAGMELVEYQSHSLYFSRYPRGREATISWPKPDFGFRNDTPYGVLIWPTYNDTSITVTFYSTRHIVVEDLGRTESPQGMCTRVTTTRQRTWPDGRTERDTVFALYRPSEGLDCNGNPTTPPPTTTVVSAPGTTETTVPPAPPPPTTTTTTTTTTSETPETPEP